jgi:hypothetical protein
VARSNWGISAFKASFGAPPLMTLMSAATAGAAYSPAMTSHAIASFMEIPKDSLPKPIAEIGVRTFFPAIFSYAAVSSSRYRVRDGCISLDNQRVCDFCRAARRLLNTSRSTEICYVDFAFRRSVITFLEAIASGLQSETHRLRIL